MSRELKCRSCGEPALRPFLSLGNTPLADALVLPERVDEPEGRFPLDVAFCEACSLVQILEEVPPEQLFVDNYLYFSSFSDELLRHSREHALGLIDQRALGPESLVVELASNDGYLLRNFADKGIPVAGVDPAPDQAEAAEAAGIPTIKEFFGPELARRMRADLGPADVIIANNVMAHVPDLNGFVEGMSLLIADDGLITVENPYVRELIRHCEFDTIYHEHFCYFSCTAVDALVRRHGLFLNHVEFFPDLHGGTLRWHIGPREDVSDVAAQYLDQERRDGLDTFEYFAAFAERVDRIRASLVDQLRQLRGDGATIAAYGSSAPVESATSRKRATSSRRSRRRCVSDMTVPPAQRRRSDRPRSLVGRRAPALPAELPGGRRVALDRAGHCDHERDGRDVERGEERPHEDARGERDDETRPGEHAREARSGQVRDGGPAHAGERPADRSPRDGANDHHDERERGEAGEQDRSGPDERRARGERREGEREHAAHGRDQARDDRARDAEQRIGGPGVAASRAHRTRSGRRSLRA